MSDISIIREKRTPMKYQKLNHSESRGNVLAASYGDGKAHSLSNRAQSTNKETGYFSSRSKSRNRQRHSKFSEEMKLYLLETVKRKRSTLTLKKMASIILRKFKVKVTPQCIAYNLSSVEMRKAIASETNRNVCSPTSLDSSFPVEHSKTSEEIKKVLVIASHRQLIMNNLSSLWKKKQLCDAGISNGTATVKVHKLVLAAVCPSLISTLGTDTLIPDYIQVNFPKEVSIQALNAFAEYMYNGILDLNCNILKQLKIIAKKLNMKEFEQLCHSHLPKKSANAAKRPLVQMAQSTPMISLLNTFHHQSPVSMDSAPSVTTSVVDTNQESTQHELGQIKMDTDHMFGQESEVASLAQNKSGNSADVAICPSIKTESVEPKDNKYGHLSSKSHQVFASTISPSEVVSLTPNKSGNSARVVICPNIKAEPVEPENNKYGHVRSTNPLFTSTTSPYSTSSTAAASSSIASTEFSIRFSQSTDGKSTKLKPTHSYETPLVSDISPVSCIAEPICSQSSPMNEDASKQLSRQSLPTPSLQLPPTSTNNQGMYPGGPSTASAGNQSSTRSTNVELRSTSKDNVGIYPVALFMAGGNFVSLLTPNAKSIDSYKTKLT